MSNSRKDYLKKIHRENTLVVIFRVLLIVIFLIGWELLANKGIINTFTFSSPYLVINTIGELLNDGDLFLHIGVTLYETMISFFLASIIGIVLATLLWSNTLIYRIFDPYFTILNSLPKVALGPLIIIWVGASMNSIIFMSLLISTFISIINMYNGFINTDKNKIKLLRSFKASKWQILWNLVIPSNYHVIVNSLKINVSMSLIGVIMGEFLVSKEGIGYLINYGSQVFNLNLVFGGIIILLVVSYVMYIMVVYIEKILIRNN